MTFKGWTNEALAFYQGLEADNSKEYWSQHKAVYETAVREPMEELLAEIEGDFGSGRVYRPQRDTRFSTDKTPYKTAACGILNDGGIIQISAAGLAAGIGFQGMDSAQLTRFRESVVDDAKREDLLGIVQAMDAEGLQISPGEQLKGAPRGFDKDHPQVEWLRKKDLYSWYEWPVEPWLETPAAKDRVVQFLTDTRPLHKWLMDNVGEAAGHRPRYGSS
jgi:uncharacterized protein (TIGR02453 family)